MTKYLAGVLTVIAVGVLGVAYGLLVPRGGAVSAFEANYPGGVVSIPGSQAAGYLQAPGAPMYQGAAPMYVPASYAPPMPVAAPVPVVMSPAPMAPAVREPRGVRDVSDEQEPVHRTRRRSTIAQVPRRDWKRTAMIVGGSSATGAGLGAIFGGKKGALIGAAIGGGASTIFETVR